MRIPEISSELVEVLDKLFPNRVIGHHETHEQHLRYAGQRDLVEWLRFHHEVQNSSDLTEEERDALLEEDIPEPESGFVRFGHPHKRGT